MTILQKDPFATLQCCLDHFFCYRPLSLTQRDRFNPRTHREIEVENLSQAILHCFVSFGFTSSSLQQTA